MSWLDILRDVSYLFLDGVYAAAALWLFLVLRRVKRQSLPGGGWWMGAGICLLISGGFRLMAVPSGVLGLFGWSFGGGGVDEFGEYELTTWDHLFDIAYVGMDYFLVFALVCLAIALSQLCSRWES